MQKHVSAVCLVTDGATRTASPTPTPSPTPRQPQVLCANVVDAGIDIRPKDLGPLFVDRTAPFDDAALAMCLSESNGTKVGQILGAAVPPLAPHSGGLTAGAQSNYEDMVAACAAGKGIIPSGRQAASWGPLGGPGATHLSSAPSNSFSCTSGPYSPYGEGAGEARGLVYQAAKAIFNLGNGIVNGVQDRELFDLLEGKQFEQYEEDKEAITRQAAARFARWEAEDAWEAATDAQIAADHAAGLAAGSKDNDAKAAAIATAAAAAAANRAAAEAQAAADRAAAATTLQGAVQAWDEAQKKRQEAEKKAGEATSAAGDAAGGKPLPEGTTNISACQMMQKQISQCEAGEWKDPSCTQLLARLRNCANPGLINPGPDGVLVCGSQQVFTAKQIQAVKSRACGALIARPEIGGGVCLRPVTAEEGGGYVGGPRCDPTIALDGCPRPDPTKAPAGPSFWCPPPIPNTPIFPCLEVSGGGIPGRP